MKNILKKAIKLSLICSLLIFSSCEKDLYEDSIHSDKITSRKISFEEFNKNQQLSNQIKKYNLSPIEQVNSLKQSKLVYLSDKDFFIDTDDIILIEKANYKCYNFPIYRKTENGLVENLLFSKDDDGSFKELIVKYSLTAQEKEIISNGGYVEVGDKSEFEDLTQNPNYNPYLAKERPLGLTTTVNGLCYQWGYTRSVSYSGIPGQIEASEWILGWNEIPCASISSGADAEQPFFLFNLSNFSGGATGPSPGSTGPKSGGVITHVNLTSLSYIRKLIKDIKAYLPELNSQEIDYLSLNPKSAQEILSYLEENSETLTEEQKQKIIDLINTCVDDGSEFNIDDSITENNALVFNTVDEYKNYVNSLNDNISNTTDLVSINSDTKVAKFKITVNFFTDFNVEIQQKTNPWSLENISSSISGNTFCLSYNQMTPADGGQVTTSGNIKTIEFSGDLNINVFFEGLGTIHTYHLTIIVSVDSSTGAPISAEIIGLP